MRTSEHLTVGQLYSRKGLQEKFDIADRTINTGVFIPRGHSSVWLFVTEFKSADRIPYRDRLEGDMLHWDGQRQGRTDRYIIEHRARGLELLLFYRESRDEHPDYAFRYEGPFEYQSHEGQYPTHFVLTRADPLMQVVEQDIEALEAETVAYEEGGVVYRYTSVYERNPKLRRAAIRIHGLTCQVCGFNFEQRYGERGRNYIEVHHVRPISTLTEAAEVNPETDMAVVCANCHRMIHRMLRDVLTVEKLREIVQSRL